MLIDEQDRTLWDRAKIAEARALLERALAPGSAGVYALQAAIAGLHATAPSPSGTDWTRIVRIYDLLMA